MLSFAKAEQMRPLIITKKRSNCGRRMQMPTQIWEVLFLKKAVHKMRSLNTGASSRSRRKMQPRKPISHGSWRPRRIRHSERDPKRFGWPSRQLVLPAEMGEAFDVYV